MAKLDMLVHLIENTDSSTFRELVLDYLSTHGYVTPRLTDGPYDGGQDFAIFQIPPRQTPVAVQTTVQKKGWESKLKADAAKALAAFKIEHMLFFSSRRIEETDFSLIATDILGRLGVHVTRFDSQSLASAYFTEHRTTRLLEILNIPGDTARPETAPQLSVKEEAAFSFAFFGRDPNSFRAAVVEGALMSYLVRNGPTPRTDLIPFIRSGLGLTDSQDSLIHAAVDRLLQRGELLLLQGSLLLSDDRQDDYRALQILRNEQWEALSDQVVTFLAQELEPATASVAGKAAMQDLGALLLVTGPATADAMKKGSSSKDLWGEARNRLLHLNATLDAFSYPSGPARDTALRKLASIATSSPLAQLLIAGELFVALMAMETPSLIRALGGRGTVAVFFDSSVAIPIICIRLFERPDERHFLAADHVYRQLKSHEIPMRLPRAYLEECATHLMQAARDYSSLVERDNDLRYSRNAFVAHYSWLARAGTVGDFRSYLRGYGFPSAGPVSLSNPLSSPDGARTRDLLMDELERRFIMYGIQTYDLPKPKKQHLARAETEVQYVLSKIPGWRHPILVTHDTGMVASLIALSADPSEGRLLCTQDRRLLMVSQVKDFHWDAMRPDVLGDVLALASPTDSRISVVTPISIAMSLADSEAELGAAVLDTLVNMEGERLHDADLLAKAQEFKRAYVRRGGSGNSDLIRAEWMTWKNGG